VAERPRVLRPDAAGVAAAVAALAAGDLAGLPTETVYGLAADATSGEAVARIYAAKGRPRFNPLIAHVPDLEAAEAHGVFGPQARALAERFWPGALTLVVPARPGSGVSDLARAGLDTVAVRVPAHPAARAVLASFGRPIAAPSANRSGHVSATTAAHVVADLGATVAVVLDAGPSPVGVESTIVGLAAGAPVLLRPGGVPRADIEAVLARPLAAPEEGAVAAPGMLASHYAPRAPVRLDATRVRPGEAALDFGGRFPPSATTLDLSRSGDLVEAAANLFGQLRALDAGTPLAIAVAPIPRLGLGEAIRDRLARAAAPRP
jgi:L-threonylcarbamoyladenylate synthase